MWWWSSAVLRLLLRPVPAAMNSENTAIRTNNVPANKQPGGNFLELFMSGAPQEQTLKAAQTYFGGNEKINIVSSNPEKQSNTIYSIGGGYGTPNPTQVKKEEVEWPKTVGDAWEK